MTFAFQTFAFQIVRGDFWSFALPINVTEQPSGTHNVPNLTADSVIMTIGTAPPTVIYADVTTFGASGVAVFSQTSAEANFAAGIYSCDIVWQKQDGSQETLYSGTFTVRAVADTGLTITVTKSDKVVLAVLINVTEQPSGLSFSPNLTADSVVLTIQDTPTPLTFNADVTTSGATGTAIFTLTSAQMTIIPGQYDFDIVWHLANGNQKALQGGSFTINPRVA